MPTLSIYLPKNIYLKVMKEVDERLDNNEKISQSTPIVEALKERYNLQDEE